MKAAKSAKPKLPVNQPEQATKQLPAKSQQKPVIYAILLFTIACILYGQTIHFDFAMDDNIMIKLNKSVQKGTAGFGELFTKSMVYGSNGRNDGAYRPITMMSFALDKQVFGNKPEAFHFINVLLYAVSSIFLFSLLRAFFPTWHLFFPFLIVLLFITHPVHTEVVANIKSRDEILSFMFSVLAMLMVFRSGQSNAVVMLWLAFPVFLLGCLSKETALTLVVLVPMSLYFFTTRSWKEILKTSLPFFAGALVYMLLRTSFLDSVGSSTAIRVIDNTLMAAANANEKYATILFITWKYLWLLIFPHPLSWDYSIKQIPICNFSEIRTLLPLLLFTAMVIFTFLGLKSRNVLSWCILFFFTTLALVSNILIPIAATMAERFLYFPSLSFCMALVFVVTKLTKTDLKSFSWFKNRVLLTVIGVIVLAYSAKTYARSGDWRNNLALFESGVKSAPNSTRTHSSLAYEYAVQAEQARSAEEQRTYYTKSIEEFKTALAIYDGNREGWYNIAHTYDLMNNFDEAEKYYKKAIEIDPKTANAYNNLGAIYLRKKNYEPAKALFRKAMELDRYYADPFGNMGAAFHFENNFQEAIRYYEMALAINPNLQTVLGNITKAKESLAQQSENKR